jgi:hypothetical protein
MIALLEASSPSKKRQKLSFPPSAWIHVKKDEELSSLGGVEDQYDPNHEEEEVFDISRCEEVLLNRVIQVYERFEEDSLLSQSKLRSEMTSRGRLQRQSIENQLRDEKLKCSILKVLTLVLQTGSRLKGSSPQERIDLKRRVKHLLNDHSQTSLDQLKAHFVHIMTSREIELFPPRSVSIPSPPPSPVPENMDSSSSDSPAHISGLVHQTERVMKFLERSSKASLERRLVKSDWQSSLDEEEEEDWEGMHDVWYAWLHFPPKSTEQVAVWEETLEGQLHRRETLDSLLWNLAYYLSMDSY